MLFSEKDKVRDLLELVDGVDPENDDDVIDLIDEYTDAFFDQLHLSAQDEALEFMDRYTGDPERLSLEDQVYVRFPSDAPYEARRMRIHQMFGIVEKGIVKEGQSEQQMPTVSIEVDPGCDDTCPEHFRGSTTYCVPEYPDFEVKCGTTSRGQFCVWMEAV